MVAVSHSRPIDVAEADATEALALARVLGDPETLAIALHARSTVDQDLNHLDARAALADELAHLGETHAKPAWRGWAVPGRARISATRGDFDHARGVLEELETEARALHDPVGLYHAVVGISSRRRSPEASIRQRVCWNELVTLAACVP